MKKNFKRWLALVLAVVLVSGTCLTHTDSFLWATDGETTETASEDVQDVVNETGETDEQQTVEQQPVEEKQEVVIPKKEDAPAPEETGKNDPVTNEKPEANQSVQDSKPADEGSDGQEVEVVPSEKKENFYNVVFHKPAVEGGTLYVWEEGKEKEEASYINGEFTKEVKEGTTLYFEIQTADNYSVEKVTDKSGEVMTPEETTENTSIYKMVVKEKNEITILYKEVKEEEPTTFNVQDESDRLLGGSKEAGKYPEYITANDLGPLGYYNHEPNVHPNSDKNENCQTKDYYISKVEDRPQNKHYVHISDGGSGEITYVRCDKYGTVDPGQKNYIVTFKNGSVTPNQVIAEKAYVAGTSINPADVPKLQGGVWKKEGSDQVITEWGNEKVNGPTTYIWYKTEKYTITTEVVNGKITDTITNIPKGENRVVKYQPNTGYKLGSVTVDGEEVTETNPNSYEFKNISENHTINVVYERNVDEFSITGINKVYDGTPATIATVGTVENGEKWQYSTDEKNWVEDIKNVTYTDVTVSDTNQNGQPVYARVVNGNAVVWESKEAVYVKITPATYTVTTKGATKTYDGTPLTKKDGAEVKGLKNGETVTLEVTGSRTEVGKSTNGYTITWNQTAKESNYQKGTEDLGTLEVTAKSIADGENMSVNKPSNITYDGGVHKWEPEVKDGDNVLEEGRDYTVSYSTTDFTNVTGDITVTITGTGNYNGTVTRTYKITPATYTVTTQGATREYNGLPLTEEGNDIKGIVTKDQEEVKVTNTGTITDVGEADNTYRITWGNAKSTNYINQGDTIGKLIVTAKSIETSKDIQVNSPENVPYNGQKQAWEPEVKDGAKALVKGTDYTVSYSKEDLTNVTGEIKVTIAGKGNYAGEVTRTYQITPVTIKVSTEGASKTYDGKPLTNPKNTVEGLVNDETLEVKNTGSITEVGTTNNTYTVDWKNEKTTAQERNYIVKDGVLGKLEVTEAEYQVEVTGYTGIYDGKPHGITVKAPEDATVTYLDENKNQYTDATKEAVTVNYEIRRPNYKKITGSATVFIDKATYTVTTKGATKEYDGTPLTKKDGAEVKGLVGKEEVTLKVTGSRTKAGESDNTYEIVWDKTAKESNYQKGTEDLGKLKVTAKSIETSEDIRVNKPENKKYDGKAHKWEPEVKDGDNVLEKGRDYTVSYSTEDFTNVTGKITVAITGAGNYAGEVTRTYEITPATYTVATKGATKTYDGTPLTKKDGAEVKGLKNGETVTLEVTGSQTEVGKSTNGYTITWNQTAKESNYQKGTEDLGTLEVTAKSIVDGENMSVNKPSNITYDGGVHKWEPEVKDGDKVLEEGRDYTVSYSTEDFTNVTGKIKVTITGAGNYAGEVTRTYEITPATYTVTTKGATKTYDGTPLTKKDGAEVKGLKNGETVTLEVTGSRTEVGTSRNGYTITWNQTAKESNYQKGTEDLGTLEVTAKSIVDGENMSVSTPTDITYDGGVHKWEPEVKDGDNVLTKGRDYTVSYSTTDFTNVTGVITVTITGAGNYAGEVTRTYQITPATIEVTADNNGKVVGQKDPKLTYTVTKDSKVNGEKAAFDGKVERETGEKTGTYGILAGSLKLIDSGAFLASNYKLSVVPGTFTIEDADYTVTKTMKNVGTGKNGSFKAGEKAVFEIKVTNNSKKYAVKEVVVEDVLSGGSGRVTILPGNYTVEGTKATIAELNAGETMLINVEYEVTQSDIDNQNEITNIAKVADTSSEKVNVPTEKKNPDFTSSKELTNEGTGKDGSFKVGEIATFAIKVQNTGNVTLNNIVVKEELKGAEIVAGTDYTINEDGFAVISTLKVGTTVIVNAQYQITQTDVDNGGTNNIVTVEGKGPGTTDPETEKPDEKVPTDDKKPEAVTTKKLTNTGSGENGSFKVGETAEFDITVQNTGNVTLKDVVVKEDLKGAKIVKGDGYTVSEDGTEAIIEAIEVGATSIVKAEYVITQEDIDNGGTSNSATVDIPGKENPQKPTEEIPTETQKPNMASSKILTNQGTGENGAFKVGEVAKFDILVENKGNVTLKDVTVTEELAGATIVAGEDYTVSKDGKIATIETLAVEGKVTVKAEYKITQADVDNGGEINSVTVEGEGTGGKDPEPVDPEVPIPTDPEKPALTSTKALTNKGTGTDGKFKAGDTAEFDITVTNTGNVTLNDVTVREQLSGAKIVTGEGYTVSEDGTVATIATLNVGETVVVKATYVVTQADVDNSGVKNIASVEGEGAGGKDPEPVDPEVPIPTEPQKPDFTSEKKLTNKGTGFLGKFKVGETATFDITVANTGNVTLKNITVKEQLAGAKIVEGTGYTIDEAGVAVIETLEVGTTVVVKAEYVITQEDVDNGGVKNKVAVNGNGPDEKDPKPQPETPEEEIPTDDKKPTAITDKILTNSGSGENGSFKVGETAEFDITVQNTGNVTLKDVVVKEMLNGAKIVAGDGYTVSADGKSATIATIKVGDTATVKAVYTMTQADVDNGEVINTADVEVPGKPDPQKPTEPIPTDPQSPAFTATKTLTNEGTGENGNFKVGDIAKFDITVTNTGNITLNDVKVKEQLAGAKFVKGDGYTVSADGTTATIQTMEVGATVLLKAEYTITQEDVDYGSAVNSIIVEGEGTGDKDPEPVDPEEPIPTDPQKPAFTSTKTLTSKGTGTDGKFKVGDTAEFDITVTNTGNVTLNNVTVTEQLSGAKIATGKGYTVSEDGTVATIDTLNVGETIVVKATYVVTQADVDNGGVKNIASVEGEGTGGKDPEPVDPEEPIPTEPQKPDFTSEKKLTNEGTGANGKFKVGETAKFDITVENTGNVTLNNITVTEQLEGAVILAGSGYKVVDGVAVIDTLEVGTTVVVKAEYVITQEDVDNGGVKNIVTVEGEGAGTTDPKPVDPEVEIPTDDKKPTAITAKTLTNFGSGENGSFKVGETAEFDITVENTGNVTLKDVVVKEMLNGAKIVAGEGYTVSADGKSATITTIKVGETATVKAVYTITQADVDNGGVINTADVEVPGKTDPQSPDEQVTTDPQKPEFTSEKKRTNEGTGADGKFKVGDTAEFDITVKNTGNVTLKDVTVKEQLAGAKIIAGEGYKVSFDGTAVIDTLEVGATVVVKAVYTITQADVDNGGVVNSVAVEGKGPNGEDPKPVDPQEPIPTEDPDPSMSVQKTVTSTNEVYNVGDTITYQIVVKNDGNITLHNVVVTDTLQNAAGEVTFEETEGVTFAGNTAIIDVMAPGETVTLNCSYVVTRADAGNDIINTAVGDSDETDPTDPSVTEPSDVEDIYNLTINYVYADGRTAAPSVVAQYLAGESFGYASPTIDGYTPDYAFVRTGAEGMPARDVVVTVVYTAIPVPAPTPTPDTPDTPDTPVTPTTPDAGTTTPTDDAVGAEITTNEEGEVEVVPVIEEEVPLAKRDLDDHDCCILHFLLMLAAMIVYAAYTRSMKKRQERIAELAEELETEMLKRKQQESAE